MLGLHYPLADAIRFWLKGLADFPDPYIKWSVLLGIIFGFPIYKWHPNLYPFSLPFKQVKGGKKAQAEIRKLVDRWLIKGIISEVKNPVGLHLNPVYVIPKGDPANPRGWRLIVNNSFPSGTSVNDVIPRYFKKCTLPTFANVVNWVQNLGPEGYVAVLDLADAWKQARIHPKDRWMLAWSYDGRFFIENALPFGFGPAVRIFTWLDACISWIFYTNLRCRFPAEANMESLILYIDDFSIGAKSKSLCHAKLECMIRTCLQLGLELNPRKTQMPSQFPEILGFWCVCCKKLSLNFGLQNLFSSCFLTQC